MPGMSTVSIQNIINNVLLNSFSSVLMMCCLFSSAISVICNLALRVISTTVSAMNTECLFACLPLDHTEYSQKMLWLSNAFDYNLSTCCYLLLSIDKLWGVTSLPVLTACCPIRNVQLASVKCSGSLRWEW